MDAFNHPKREEELAFGEAKHIYNRGTSQTSWILDQISLPTYTAPDSINRGLGDTERPGSLPVGVRVDITTVFESRHPYQSSTFDTDIGSHLFL